MTKRQMSTCETCLGMKTRAEKVKIAGMDLYLHKVPCPACRSAARSRYLARLKRKYRN